MTSSELGKLARRWLALIVAPLIIVAAPVLMLLGMPVVIQRALVPTAAALGIVAEAVALVTGWSMARRQLAMVVASLVALVVLLSSPALIAMWMNLG
jgi:hypothetical protein